MQTKIRSEHLSRLAFLYIRQSSLAQVHEHLESQRLQYQLVQRAQELGWAEPVVIDDDLGISGSGKVVRPGFSRLLEAVGASNVGAVFCWDASRLARNSREWHLLIDYCATVDTLIIDRDGIYDPNNMSDRVYLGMKGTFSEYEVGMLRQRAQAARLEKAKRGELYIGCPVGYCYTPDHGYELDPNQQVRQTIALVFKKFREFGSANQVLLWLRSEGIEVPYRTSNRHTSKTLWKLPLRASIANILKNPFYAGVYAYGRKQSRLMLKNGQPIRTGGHELPPHQWKVLLRDHHAAYIEWNEYLANREQLSRNGSIGSQRGKMACKGGPALLVGLLRCQRCGRLLHVSYKGTNAKSTRYACRGQQDFGHTGGCLTFSGTRIEELVEAEVLRVIEPAAITAAEKAEQLFFQQQAEKEKTMLAALKRVTYDADRRFEQYNAVDARNRLVAQTLETRWNEALQQVHHLEQQVAQLRQSYQPLSKKERQAIYRLAEDLPRVWEHAKADTKIKKRILHVLITEIMVDILPENAFVVSIHWAGGKHTQYRLKRQRAGERQSHLHPEIQTLLRDLAEVATDSQIARILNLSKIKTASGKSWIAARVKSYRHKYKIAAFDADIYARKGWMNLQQVAEQLGTAPMTVYRLIKAQIIDARQVIRYAPWVIEKEQLDRPGVRGAVARMKKGPKSLLTNDRQQLSLI